MKLWSAWLPDLLPHVPGCPTVVAEHELRRAAQAFFQQTRAWQVILPAVAVAANQAEVDVTPTDTTLDLVRVQAAAYDGKPLGKQTAEDLDAEFSDDWTAHTGTPGDYIQLTPNVLRLYPVPTVAATTGVKVRAAVAPSHTSTGLPDDLADRFWDEMHAGAKARLMLYPGKPWTNTELAAVYGQAFTNMVATATAAAARAYGQARIPARVKWC